MTPYFKVFLWVCMVAVILLGVAAGFIYFAFCSDHPHGMTWQCPKPLGILKTVTSVMGVRG